MPMTDPTRHCERSEAIQGQHARTKPLNLVAKHLAVTTLLLTACSQTTPNLRYTGTLTPAKPSPSCQPSRATLTLRDGQVVFTPNEGIWILTGTAQPGGTLTAQHAAIGADKKPFSTTLTATWSPTTAEGTYLTPRCTFQFKSSSSP